MPDRLFVTPNPAITSCRRGRSRDESEVNALIDLSIIVVSYNTCGLLRNCLNSVFATFGDLSVETFIVDNASSDESSHMVATEFPSACLVQNERNIGFAAANNMALGQACGRYILLLNSDAEVPPNAPPELVRFMESTPTAGYCGPRLVNGDGSHQPSARRFPTLFSAAFSMLGLSSRFPESRHALDLHSLHGDRERFPADWLTGACLMVRTEAIRQVGLLDEGFFMYFEETDWCRRLSAAGWEGWYVPSAEVMHLGGQSVASPENNKAFSGDHPAHWTNSRRRYGRRYFGAAGMLLSELIQIALYALIWLRHRWRRSERSRSKARSAAIAIRHLLAPTWQR